MTPKKETKFLQRLAEGASVSGACGAAAISRTAAYNARNSNEAFAARWDEALNQGTERLEDEAYRRAHTGVDEPIFYKGEECGVVRKYSDTLLIFLLKAHRPEKYRENIRISVTEIDAAIEQQLARLAARGETEVSGAAEDEIIH